MGKRKLKKKKSFLITDIRLQRGDKPLEKKKFYLDIKNHALANKLEIKIKDFGGVSKKMI